MGDIIEENAVVLHQCSLAEGIYDMVLQSERIVEHARAGQFVSLYSSNPAKLLPRPISLCGIDRINGEIRLVYRVTGEGTGTEEFSRLRSGDTVRVLGPLGNGYVPDGRRALLMGGGIGIPPMLGLAQKIHSTYPDAEITAVLGYRDANVFLSEEFARIARVVIATEDGSVGTRGNVLDAVREEELAAEVIYACGPVPMLRALQKYAFEKELPCYLSLEERMACGIGACLACVCPTTRRDAHSNVNNSRVCKDGPVFDAREVKL